ncbi:MAG: TRAP transporter substrate-binding protein DctP [Candidatus Aminicenantes bacterium]|nr:MAG: TRAP transporter substrate-binding protein DctP [Candidatus Aminicenantes bacterium]
MKIEKIILLFILSALILTGSVYSQETITIKIGTISPERTPWHKALNRISSDWTKITGGKVRLRIFAGGIAGNEVEIVEKMRSGKLGGAALTLEGISSIYRDVNLFYTPLLFTDDEEFNYVFDKLKEFFEKEIEKKGFKMICWSSYGWVRFFSKNPVFYPEDLQDHKLSITTENPGMVEAAKNAGFDPVPIDFNDLMMNLQSGKVTAFYHSPIIAAAGQYYNLAPNMCSLLVGPGIGVLFISKTTWENIPDQYEKQMIEAAKKINNDLSKEIGELEEEAIKEMEEYDLIVNRLPADAQKKWQSTLDKFINGLIKGKVFSKEVYKRVQKHKDEYRKEKGNKVPAPRARRRQ